jgi:hypothetical protein
MIRKFNDFKVNELNTSTYLSAANKFKKLGGRHEKRASELSFWAHNKDSYKFGTFSIKADVWNGKYGSFIAPISDREIYNKEKNKYKIKQEGPIDVYINFDSNKDFYYDDPTHRRPITVGGLRLFSKKHNKLCKEQDAASSRLGDYFEVDFEILEWDYMPSKDFKDQFVGQPREEVEAYLKQHNNIIEELWVKLVVIKG